MDVDKLERLANLLDEIANNMYDITNHIGDAANIVRSIVDSELENN